MRILLFAAYWPRPNDDHSVYFEVGQVGALVEMGHEVDVVLATPPWRRKARFIGGSSLGLDASKVRIFQIVLPRLPESFSRNSWGALINVRLCGCFLSRWLRSRKTRYDAAVIHSERNIGLAAAYWNSSNELQAIMVIHGPDNVIETLPTSFRKRYFGQPVGRALDQVILVGSSLRSYAQTTGYPEEKTRVILNGFIPPRQKAKSPILIIPNSIVRLITVGRLIYWKGQDDLINALAQLRSEHPELSWHLDIIGTGPREAALRKLANDRGLSEYVKFHGSVTHKEVFNFLHCSEIFILPSWKEAFGVVYLEAMASGNAVVGCHDNGAADILTHGVDGCLVPPRDVPALAATLEKLIADPDRRQALARAALDSVRRFSWQANAQALLEELR